MTSDKRHHRNEEDATCRKPSDFTIEHILNRAGNSKLNSSTTCTSFAKVNTSVYNYLQLPPLPQLPQPQEVENYATTRRNIHSYTNDKCYQEAQELNDTFDSQNSGLPFTWLQCTRYCPPKIPRKYKNLIL